MQTQTNEQKLKEMLAALWDRSRHTVAERAEHLKDAGVLLLERRLDDPSRRRAVDSAHKLAGVLGTFGLPRGTELAREAEDIFNRAEHAGDGEVEFLQVLLAELMSMVDRGPLGPQ